MSPVTRACVLCVLAVVSSATSFAQAPPQAAKAPNQVVPNGQHEPAISPGRAREATPEETAALAAALRQFEKRADGVTFTYFSNGMVRAELDESFMEALTVTVMPDGSLKYAHGPLVLPKDTAKKIDKAVSANKPAALIKPTTKSPEKE